MQRLLLVAVALAATLAPACTSAGHDAALDPFFAEAVAATKQARTGRYEIAAQKGLPTTDDTAKVGEGVASFDGVNRLLSMEILGTAVEIRVVDGATFMKADPRGQLAELTQGRWQREPPPSPGGLTPITRLFAPYGGDPFSVLDARSGVSGGRRTGAEQVRGVTTTRYRFSFAAFEVLPELKRLLDTYPPPERKLIVDNTEASLRLWLDGSDRIRRVAYTVDSRDASPYKSTFYVVTEFFDFGVPVDVKRPPQEQVIDTAAVPQPSP